ncbi:MAG TPA: MYG1 family protein [Geopsychrobacteraceae bacterium]|nr:MYG1 family protein [Geopsychrobacteraceae bacterium]
MYRIVAHPGSAHRDDFLSVSILLTILEPVEVFRREPTAADLADPNTYVVDAGMEYNPENHNFDHHHDPSLPCAFHLVMKHFGHHDNAMEIFGWYAHMSMMDVRGPYQTAEHLGIETSVLFAASSPIDGYILSRFSRVTSLTTDDLLYDLMKDLGREMIEQISLKKARLERLRSESEIVRVKNYKILVSRIEEDPKLSMELYLRDLNDESIIMSISPSVRGEGWEMLRLGDNTMVDFRALSGHKEIHFVHANGFVAKTGSLIPMEQAIELASQAINDQ